MEKLLKSSPKSDIRLNLDIFELFYDLFNELFVEIYDEYCKPYTKYRDLSDRSIGQLDSALHTCAFLIDDTNYYYRAYDESTAAYLYYVNKDHVLNDGNKRLSIATALIYLGINKKWLDLDWRELHKLALSIASAKAEEINKDDLIANTSLAIKEGIVDWDAKKSLQAYSWINTEKTKEDNLLSKIATAFKRTKI